MRSGIPLLVLLFLQMLSAEVSAQTDTLLIYFNKGSDKVNIPVAKILDAFLARQGTLSEGALQLFGPGGEGKTNDTSLAGRRIASIRAYIERRNARQPVMASRLGDPPLNTTIDSSSDDERWVAVVVDQLPEMDSTLFPALSNLQKDEVMVLQNLEFEGGSPTLLRSSMPVLYGLLATLQRNPQLKIRLEGHVCCIYDREGPEYMRTTTLSYKRAEAVYNFLVRNGIPASRLSITGFGNTKPLVINGVADISNHRNRRVEVRILER